MRGELQEAYVIHRRRFRETSLLLDLFCRDHGMVRVLAKGVNRGRAEKVGLLQPFALLSVSWAGRSELPVLAAVELAQRHALTGRSALCALYLNELLVRLLPVWDPHASLFAEYRNTLEQLAGGAMTEQVLRCFELTLLEELGYAPPLDFEGGSGRPVMPDQYYDYRPEHGPELCVPHPRAFRGGALLALGQRRLSDPGDLMEAKRVMRLIINHALGGRALKSRELFKFIKFEGS